MVDWLAAEAGMVLAGAGLGVVFYGGLWLTLRRLPRARHPCVLVLCSLLVRILVVLGGIWLCSGGRPSGIVAGIVGFILVQLLSTYRASMASSPARKRSVP